MSDADPLALAARSRTMNRMTVGGYHAKIEYDEELDLFRCEIFGLNGCAYFYGNPPQRIEGRVQEVLVNFPGGLRGERH